MASSLSQKYAKRAADSKASKKDKEAAELVVKCEKLIDEEKDKEALEAAKAAVAAFKALKDKAGTADAVRIQSQVLIYQDERKEAAQVVKENLAEMQSAKDESGQAKLLLAMAEINSGRDSAKRDEGLEQATEALGLFKKLGDKQMEASAQLTLSSIHLKRSNKMAGAADAVACATDAMKTARSIGDKHGEASALHAYAVSTVQTCLLEPSCCLNTLTFDPAFEDGINAASEALRIWQEIGNKAQESYELACLAQWKLVAGQNEEALPDAERSAQLDTKGHKAYSVNMHVQALLSNQEVDEAVRVAEEALGNARTASDEKAELAILDVLLAVYCSQGDQDKAVESAEAALDLCRDKDDLVSEMRLQGSIAQLHLDRQDYGLAAEAAEEMFRIAEESEDKKMEARARQVVSQVLKAKGDIKGALREAKALQKIYQDSGDEKGQALALLEVADVQYQKAQYEEALQNAEEAQETFRNSGDKNGEAATLGMLAEINQMLGNSDAVLKASARHRSLLKSIGDKKGEAAAALQTCHARLYMLANSGYDRGSIEYTDIWSRAYKEAKDGMTLAYSHGEDHVYAQSFYLLGQVYCAVNNKSDEALQCSSQAVEMYKEIGDIRGEAQSQVTVGHAYHLMHKKEEAQEAISKANALFQEIGDSTGMTLCQQALKQFVGIQMAPPGGYAQWGGDQQWGQQQAYQQGASGAPEAAAPAADVMKVAKLDFETIMETVKETVTGITMMDVESDTPLMQAGLTSNTTVLFRNELSQIFPGKHLPFTLVFDFPDVNAVANFLADS